ncbi:hypothetical protein [Acidihalobacter ferrooxydans]|nr:hypothetical protein [Acidihalobacter ferrooxydans]
MTFQRAPDMTPGTASPSAPPRGGARWFLLGFDRIVRGLFRIEESGLPERQPRPCLIAVNHRRDADIPVLGVFLGRVRGRRITGVLPHFVAREDLFDRDFLWHYWRSPWLIGPRLISPLIPLPRILEVFKAHPIHRIREQSLAVVLRDLRRAFGDRPLGEVLHPRWAERLAAAGASPERSIDWLLGRQQRFSSLLDGEWGHRRLNLPTFRAFKPLERARIRSHLEVFAQALATGEAVMIAPEGANSPSGFFQRPRAGAWQLAQAAGPELAVLPVGLGYDPSHPSRRTRVFVHAGAILHRADYPARRAFDDAVARAILCATTLTASHFLAHWILSAAPGKQLTHAGYLEFLEALSEPLRAAGQRVAPDAAEAFEARLRWFARAGLVARESGAWRRSQMPEPQPAWTPRAALAAYLRNELASAAALAPGLAQAFALPSPPYVPATTTQPASDRDGNSDSEACRRR